MKKPLRKNHELAITATMKELTMLQLLIETLAESNIPNKTSFKKVQRGWRSIKTSSVESHVSGAIDLSYKKTIKIPFTTCFVFTCTKEIKGKYDITWSNSLS